MKEREEGVGEEIRFMKSALRRAEASLVPALQLSPRR